MSRSSPRLTGKTPVSSPRVALMFDDSRQYKQQLVNTVYMYLRERDIRNILSLKELCQPSKSVYLSSMEILWQAVDPTITIPSVNYAEVMCKLFKAYGYRGTLTKSTLRSFSSQSSWLLILQGMAYVLETIDFANRYFAIDDVNTRAPYNSILSHKSLEKNQGIFSAINRMNNGSLTQAECLKTIEHEAKKQITNLDARLIDLEKEIVDKKNYIESIESHFTKFWRLKKELDELKAKHHELNEELRCLKEKYTKMVVDNNRLSDEIKSQKETINELTDRKKLVEAKLAEFEQNRDKVEDLLEQIKSRKRELRRLQQAKAELSVNSLEKTKTYSHKANEWIEKIVSRYSVLESAMENENTRICEPVPKPSPSPSTVLNVVRENIKENRDVNEESAVQLLLGLDYKQSLVIIKRLMNKLTNSTDELRSEAKSIKHQKEGIASEITKLKERRQTIDKNIKELTVKKQSIVTDRQERIKQLKEDKHWYQEQCEMMANQLKALEISLISCENECNEREIAAKDEAASVLNTLYELEISLDVPNKVEEIVSAWTKIYNKVMDKYRAD